MFAFAAGPDIGVPIKLLHEAENHMVTVEMKNGETYRGLLEEGEDTMNCKLSEGEWLVCLLLVQCRRSGSFSLKFRCGNRDGVCGRQL